MIKMKMIIAMKTHSKIIKKMESNPMIQGLLRCRIRVEIRNHRGHIRVINKIILLVNTIQKLKIMITNNLGINIWAKTNFKKKIFHKEVIQAKSIILHPIKIHRSWMFLRTNRKRGKLVHNNPSIRKTVRLKKSMINLLLYLLQILLTSLLNLLEELTMTTNPTEIPLDPNLVWKETLAVFHHLEIQPANSRRMMAKKCQIQWECSLLIMVTLK